MRSLEFVERQPLERGLAGSGDGIEVDARAGDQVDLDFFAQSVAADLLRGQAGAVGAVFQNPEVVDRTFGTRLCSIGVHRVVGGAHADRKACFYGIAGLDGCAVVDNGRRFGTLVRVVVLACGGDQGHDAKAPEGHALQVETEVAHTLGFKG